MTSQLLLPPDIALPTLHELSATRVLWKMSEDRFPTSLNTRATKELRDAVKRAADRNLTNTSEYVRRALLDRLKKDGVSFHTETAA